MIGTCAGCGQWGEVGFVPMPGGAQRVYCARCAATPPNERPAAGEGRLTGLVRRWAGGTISPLELRELTDNVHVLVDAARARRDPVRVLRYREMLKRIEGGRP